MVGKPERGRVRQQERPMRPLSREKGSLRAGESELERCESERSTSDFTSFLPSLSLSFLLLLLSLSLSARFGLSESHLLPLNRADRRLFRSPKGAAAAGRERETERAAFF